MEREVDFNEAVKSLVKSVVLVEAENGQLQIYSKGYLLTLKVERIEEE